MTVSVSRFSSELVNKVRENGGTIAISPDCTIMLPSTFGFCTGVNRAVTKLNDIVNGKHIARPIWLLGAMIHNPAVNEAFAKGGVQVSTCAEEVFEKASPHDIFVIPAFGLPLELDKRLRGFVAAAENIVDATCPFVRRVWNAAEQAGKQGNAVIIHGKYGHQETYGIWSRAVNKAPACVLLSTVEEARVFAENLSVVEKSRLFNPEKLAGCDWTLLNQTTMLSTETAEIAEILQKARWHRGKAFMAGTLCPATRERQAAAQELCAKGCEVIIVLGGTDSSNTTQLYRMAVERIGAEHCFFVQSELDLQTDSVRHFIPFERRWGSSMNEPILKARRIGVLAGASCPDSELERLLIRLDCLILRKAVANEPRTT
ncbi:MAG: 4-hydroxy-3-methylbut-2-enyl diphosphate reductase [Victivallales bacterium]|nr:4-hydroxy-3-methylbut-2-enyl diphosphate reductase [Victivallales bacterium]